MKSFIFSGKLKGIIKRILTIARYLLILKFLLIKNFKGNTTALVRVVKKNKFTMFDFVSKQ